MNKKDINLNDILYWNTTGAYDSKISLECEVIDIGRIWIWVHIKGCLGYNNLIPENLSKKPLYRVTNNKHKQKN